MKERTVSVNSVYLDIVNPPEFATCKFQNRVSVQARVRFSLAGLIIFSVYISEQVDG